MQSTVFLLSLLTFIYKTECKVTLSHSEYYDQYDFEGETEVRLTKCDKGCFVYASIPSNTTGREENIVFAERINGQLIEKENLKHLATSFLDTNGRKITLTFPNGEFVILNKNPNYQSTPFIIYTIKSSFNGIEPNPGHVIYEAAKYRYQYPTDETSLVLMSYDHYTIYSIDTTGRIDVYAAGYESLQPLPDLCMALPLTYEPSRVNNLVVRSPLLTIKFSSNIFDVPHIMVQYKTLFLDDSHVAVVMSPGYMGCSNWQAFRYSLRSSVEDIVNYDSDGLVNFTIYSDPNIVEDNPITVKSSTGRNLEIWGDIHHFNGYKFNTTYMEGHSLSFSWTDKYGNSSFYLAVSVTPQTTTSVSSSTVTSTTVKPQATTSQQIQTTTNTSSQIFSLFTWVLVIQFFNRR